MPVTAAPNPVAAGASVATTSVEALEVTQSVQTLTNDVPLVRGKSTVIRLYLQITSPAAGMFFGELAIAKSPGAPAQYVPSLNTVDASVIRGLSLDSRRNDFTASLNFLLPANICAWPTLSISVSRVYSADASTSITPILPQVCLSLLAAPPLRIRAVGLRYQRILQDGTVSSVAPDALHFNYLRSYLRRAYPVASVEWSQIVVDADPMFCPPFSGPPNGTGVDTVWHDKLGLAQNQLAALRAKDIATGTDPRTHYYGLVSDASAGLFLRGAAKDIPVKADPSIVAVGPAGDPSKYPALHWDGGPSYADWYGAHEISHTFGRFHPGFCGQDASDPSFPYPQGLIGNVISGAPIGFDVGDTELDIPMQILPTESSHDVMTYCQNIWISPYSYKAILDRIQDENLLYAPAV